MSVSPSFKDDNQCVVDSTPTPNPRESSNQSIQKLLFQTGADYSKKAAIQLDESNDYMSLSNLIQSSHHLT